jgi:hypothetical protein
MKRVALKKLRLSDDTARSVIQIIDLMRAQFVRAEAAVHEA